MFPWNPSVNHSVTSSTRVLLSFWTKGWSMCYLPVYPILSPGQWLGMLIDFRRLGQQGYLIVGYRYGLIAKKISKHPPPMQNRTRGNASTGGVQVYLVKGYWRMPKLDISCGSMPKAYSERCLVKTSKSKDRRVTSITKSEMLLITIKKISLLIFKDERPYIHSCKVPSSTFSSKFPKGTFP